MHKPLVAGGMFCMLFGSLNYWLNVAGGADSASRICSLGLCENAVLREIAGQSLLSDAPDAQQRALSLSAQALRLNAASPYAWLETASILQANGQTAQARRYKERAAELAQGLAPVQMSVLNYLVANGTKSEVLRHGTRVLGLTRSYDPQIFRYYRELDLSTQDVLSAGLPAQGPVAMSYLQELISLRDERGVDAVWRWIESSKLGTDTAATAYSQFLMQRGRVHEAYSAWIAVHGKNGRRVKGNLVFNPAIQYPLAPAPFDWQIRVCPGVDVERGEDDALVLNFKGEDNVSYRHIRQIVPVTAGPLLLTAKVRATDLTTNEGIYIELRDALRPERLRLSSEKLTGTAEWTEIRLPGNVMPGTKLLELAFVRDPSRKLENKIKGRYEFKNLAIRQASSRGLL